MNLYLFLFLFMLMMLAACKKEDASPSAGIESLTEYTMGRYAMVHTYTFNSIGRLQNERVTQLESGVEAGSFERTLGYNAQGQLLTASIRNGAVLEQEIACAYSGSLLTILTLRSGSSRLERNFNYLAGKVRYVLSKSYDRISPGTDTVLIASDSSTYAYSANGRIASTTSYFWTSNRPAIDSVSWRYRYSDPEGRLLRVYTLSPSGQIDRVIDYYHPVVETGNPAIEAQLSSVFDLNRHLQVNIGPPGLPHILPVSHIGFGSVLFGGSKPDSIGRTYTNLYSSVEKRDDAQFTIYRIKDSRDPLHYYELKVRK